jgi:predicted secreted hydrolase
MRPAALLLALWIVPAAAQTAPDPGVSDGFGMMRSEAEADFAEVRPETEIRFPEDHAAHPGFRIEWWYITANLRDAEDRPLGVQWTLFRFASRPEDGRETGWTAPLVWMGHAAVTTAERHLHAERFGRGGIGQAGVEHPPFRAWIDDWGLESLGEAFSPLELTARGDGFRYALVLDAEGPMVLQGEEGYSVKSERGQASHYASQPFFRVWGSVEIGAEARPVSGRAWMDREWSSQPLAEDQTGWDWFALHLPGGEKLMLYRLRHEGGADYVTGNWIAPDGTSARLAPGTVEMEPIAREEIDGREVPVRWAIAIPSRGLEIETRPLNPRAWNDLSTEYWEGPVFFSGTHEGEGYLEMTGY